MNIHDLLSELKEVREQIKLTGLQADAVCYINWTGDDFTLKVGAFEPYDENGHWNRERWWNCNNVQELEKALEELRQWPANIPPSEMRAQEILHERLRKMLDKLPTGNDEIQQEIYASFRKALEGIAERLASNAITG